MRNVVFVAAGSFVVTAATVAIGACGSENEGLAFTPKDAGGGDVVDIDASDPRCETRAVPFSDHPWAISRTSANGRGLRNVRAFAGRLYFGYGDLNENTGPVEVASLDPVTKEWALHITLQTESVERFVIANGELYAPCSDAHNNLVTDCELGIGSSSHDWRTGEFTNSVHVMDVAERVPGEIIVGGSALLPDAGPLATGAFLWRSAGAAPFQQIFPAPGGNVETGGGPFSGVATLNAVTYAVTGGSVWTWDGTTFLHARAPGQPDTPVLLGDFIHPVTVASQLVFASFGNYLFAFDGKTTRPLGLRTFETPTQLGFTEAPVAIFEESEGRLLLVDEKGDVLVSNDLKTFTCIGKAPPDVRSLGSFDGTVYFGAADAHVYAFERRSW